MRKYVSEASNQVRAYMVNRCKVEGKALGQCWDRVDTSEADDLMRKSGDGGGEMDRCTCDRCKA